MVVPKKKAQHQTQKREVVDVVTRRIFWVVGKFGLGWWWWSGPGGHRPVISRAGSFGAGTAQQQRQQQNRLARPMIGWWWWSSVGRKWGRGNRGDCF